MWRGEGGTLAAHFQAGVSLFRGETKGDVVRELVSFVRSLRSPVNCSRRTIRFAVWTSM